MRGEGEWRGGVVCELEIERERRDRDGFMDYV